MPTAAFPLDVPETNVVSKYHFEIRNWYAIFRRGQVTTASGCVCGWPFGQDQRAGAAMRVTRATAAAGATGAAGAAEAVPSV